MSDYETAVMVATEQSAVEPFSTQVKAVIKEQIAPGISDAELTYFGMVCQRTGLDPLARQIYAVMRNVKVTEYGKETWQKKMTIQTGIDGYRLIAARTGELGGIDEPIFDTDDATHPNWAKVTVWRIVKGQRVPFTAKVRWKEYCQVDGKGNPTGMWRDDKMPFNQLGKCAESAALRKGFPAELSGIYTHEEMQQADNDAPYTETYPATTTHNTPVARQEAQQRPPTAQRAPIATAQEWNREAVYKAIRDLQIKLGVDTVSRDVDLTDLSDDALREMGKQLKEMWNARQEGGDK